MTAREYLERLRTIDRDINAMLEHKQEMLERATSIRSMPDGVCVQTATSSRVESAAVALADYGNCINEAVDILVDSKREAQRMIGQIQDSRFKSILTYRYLYNWGWEKIMGQMHFESSHMFRLHGYALLEFENVFARITVDYSKLQ